MRRCWLIVLLLLGACGSPAPPEPPTNLLDRLRPGHDDGFRQASVEQPIRLPEDHLAHPDTRIEWWYLTGHLQAPDGHRFGFQLALFRFGLVPGAVTGESAWRGNSLFMAHAAVTDIDRGQIHFRERIARPLAGLTGASGPPLSVRVQDCHLSSLIGPGLFPAEVQCQGDAFGFRLRLSDQKGPVVHGQGGYSAKSEAPGSASWYYSFPRLRAEGELTLGDTLHSVQGQAWMDHEWGSGVLGSDQVGWDWFSLQLDDGSELMLFHIRDQTGAIQASRGTLIEADGRIRPFQEGVVSATAIGHWTSPASGARYPLTWRLQAPEFGLELQVSPLVEDQELRVSARYWEGAMSVSGQRNGQPLSGLGYLELTGYPGAD